MYAAQIIRNSAPSTRSSWFLRPMNMLVPRAIALTISTAMSTMFMLWNDTGAITAEVPRIRRMLNMLEPMMLPRASCPFFLTAAAMQVASSGREGMTRDLRYKTAGTASVSFPAFAPNKKVCFQPDPKGSALC